MRRPSLLAALLAIGLAPHPTGAADGPPTVVELFTSQGCSSCPPADAYLGELAGRGGVVALSFHVAYWDRLGWKDPFASAWATDRQYGYGAALGLNGVYTPQMVIDGATDAVGSHRAAIERVLEASRAAAGSRLAVALRRDAQGLAVVLPRATLNAPVGVWLARYDPLTRTTDVKRGENGGRRLENVNVVKALERVATWNGADATLRVPAPTGDGVAVLVQREGQGAILGAAALAPAG
ncbi:MAG: DUF1223 domain-containing protein [Geminicoccaceae bacterium]|nr:DUF1223 domain-containing protein [Geminicoccaceae bacterium]